MKRQMVLIASLVAGLIAALLTSAYISGKNDELLKKEKAIKEKYGEMDALCFVSQKMAGTQIKDADLKVCKTLRVGNVGLVYTPAEKEELIGRFLDTTVDANIAIRKTDIQGYTFDNSLASKIGEGNRAISINVNESTSVSGRIRPGDEVDVIGTFLRPSENPANKQGDLVTVTLLQRIYVLAVGNESSRVRGPGLGASTSSGFTTVTLQVTPREAEMLANVEQTKGRITLTLRHKEDDHTESELPVIEFNKICSQISDLNRERVKKEQNKKRYDR
jgi:Flp pilus assembly protein CpaB